MKDINTRVFIVFFVVSFLFSLVFKSTAQSDGSPTFEETKAFAERGTSGNQYVSEENKVKAQYHVGLMYYEGSGGAPQNFGEAAHWFRKAADNGSGPAESMLGQMYYKGEGVLKNLNESFKWFNHAAARGNANALSNRDEIKQTLISQYILEAQKRGINSSSVYVCSSDVQAYDPTSPAKPLGIFKEGTVLEVTDCPTITGMKNASYRLPDGKVIQGLCFAKDLEKGPQVVQYSENPLKPKPTTFEKKKWGGEPNWKSIYDNPGYHPIKPRDDGK